MTTHPIWTNQPSASVGFVPTDPRLLILMTLIVLISTFLIQTLIGLTVLLVHLVFLFSTTRRSWHSVIKGSRHMALFVLLILLINAVLIAGTPLFGMSFLSEEGVVRGVYYSLRVVVLYFTVWLFVSVTNQESVATGLAALVRPFNADLARRVGLHGFLTIGFIPLFRDEVTRIRVAQRFRGGGLDGGFVHRAAGARALLVPLLVSAIRRSEQLAMAVQVRGIESTIERVLVIGRPGLLDLAFAVVTLAVLVVAGVV